jgi:uncharacterized membrane protein YgcG
MKTRLVCLALGCLGVLTALVPACSGDNQEGPEVTCADLQCGKVNACQEGIIAQCADGQTVRYHACSSDKELCGYDWQVPGQYRCEAATTDCEGCRPDGPGCSATGGSGGSGGSALGGTGGGTGGSGGSGGSALGGTGGGAGAGG